MRPATTALLGTAAVTLLLGACGTGSDAASDADQASASTTQEPASVNPTTDGPTSDPATEPTTRQPTTSPAEDESDDGPAFPEDTERQFAESSGEWDLVLTDVRVGAHEGFDRIVLEFTGTGAPGWSVDWVDRARLDGSGEPIDLGGGATLDVYASGTTWPADGYYDGPQRLVPGGDVSEVYVGGTFEGNTQVLAGIDGSPGPVRVFALPDPPRLVVDVSHSEG